MSVKNFLKRFPKVDQWYTIYKQYTDFPLLKQPKNIKRFKTKIIIIQTIAVFIFDILSFTLKFAKDFAANGLIGWSIFMLTLYFAEHVLIQSYQTYDNFQNDLFDQEYSKESSAIVMKLCSKVRNKVYKIDEEGKKTIMEHPELIKKTKTYLAAVWKFYWKIPNVLASIATLVIMITSMIIIEIQTNSGWQTLIILLLLFACSISYFIVTKKRLKVTKSFRKTMRDSYSKEDVMLSEIYNTEFISNEDFEFHAERFRKQLVNSRGITKIERLNMNKAFVQRSIIASGFMIMILLLKTLTAEVINSTIILEVVAVSSVYSTILQKISSIMRHLESIADDKIEVETLYPEFKNIHDVYVDEESKVFSSTPVKNIAVNPFYATQDPKKTYVLHNANTFDIKTGDCILVHGPTGCGKSTLLLLLTGKLRIQNNPIVFSNGDSGYLRAIAYQTDFSLANNYAIEEITLTNDLDLVDREKLFHILHGLCLYDSLLTRANLDTDLNLQNCSNDEKVFKLLNLLKVSQFSSGQRQRIALAKLLYTMKQEHQIIALDEAFNRLNDSIAEKCACFVKNFACSDTNRIILIATHQVDIIGNICNKRITFEETLGGSELIME